MDTLGAGFNQLMNMITARVASDSNTAQAQATNFAGMITTL